jgi:Holliday junction resolvase
MTMPLRGQTAYERELVHLLERKRVPAIRSLASPGDTIFWTGPKPG